MGKYIRSGWAAKDDSNKKICTQVIQVVKHKNIWSSGHTRYFTETWSVTSLSFIIIIVHPVQYIYSLRQGPKQLIDFWYEEGSIPTLLTPLLFMLAEKNNVLLYITRADKRSRGGRDGDSPDTNAVSAGEKGAPLSLLTQDTRTKRRKKNVEPHSNLRKWSFLPI